MSAVADAIAGLSARERKAMVSLEEMGTAPERVIEALIKRGLVVEYDVPTLGGFQDTEAVVEMRKLGLAMVVNTFTDIGWSVQRLLAARATGEA